MAKEVLTAAQRIMEKFGGTWEPAGEDILLPPNAVSTGSILLNQAIGDCNGWPEGAIVEAFGPQHSGKTLMGYLAIAAAQKKYPDKPCLIMDAEHQFKFQARWAQQVGVNVPKLFVTKVVSAEECFDKLEMAILGDVKMNADGEVDKIVKPGNFSVIMIDSVTQLVPLDIVNKSMDDSKRLALLASRMSEGLKKVVSAMSRVDSPTILFFINQIRVNPGQMFGSNEIRTGGNSLPFYDTIAVRVGKIRDSEERDASGKIFAHQVKIQFEKNKAGQKPSYPIVFRLCYDGTGIDNDRERLWVAVRNRLVINKNVDEKKDAMLGVFSDDKSTVKFLIVKPGTEEPLDDNSKWFKASEFKDMLEKYPNLKKTTDKLIKDGQFYADAAIEEEAVEDKEGVAETGKKKKKESAEEPPVAESMTEKEKEDFKKSIKETPVEIVEVKTPTVEKVNPFAAVTSPAESLDENESEEKEKPALKGFSPIRGRPKKNI